MQGVLSKPGDRHRGDHNTQDTARRVAKMYKEIFKAGSRRPRGHRRVPKCGAAQ